MQKLDQTALLQEVYRRIAQRKLYKYEPYDWQRRFHNASADYAERMLRAANRVGKTYSAGAETAFHLTGQYPEWWEGRRFPNPPHGWAGGKTNEAVRDVIQNELLGNPIGTGLIPGDLIVDYAYRQAGVKNVVDFIKVRHTAGYSYIGLKSYEQGWQKFQGTSKDFIWLDEEPEDYQIFTECLTRILDAKGILYVTFTPLLGNTDMVNHFNEHHGDPSSGVFLINATWDDAPHLDEDEKTRILASYPEHEREARSKGIPMLGEGRVWPIHEEDYTCTPFEIPRHYARIAGIDFGINKDHPTAVVWLAWDRDSDIVYLYKEYRRTEAIVSVHASAIKREGDWIPVAWPHDGVNVEKGSGKQINNLYRDEGVKMMPYSAHYRPDPGEKAKLGPQPVEPIVQEVFERMQTGRFKVFSTCNLWREEARNFHRKDGKIVARAEDTVKASLYAMLMLRYAIPKSMAVTQPAQKGLNKPVVKSFG